jgi:hypothetical protein
MAEAKPKQSPKPKGKARDDTSGNQGEGNRGADRRYRKQATDFARSGRVDPAAEEARRSVEEGARDAGVGGELDQLERNKQGLREKLLGKPRSSRSKG